jgi:hypothetical protein
MLNKNNHTSENVSEPIFIRSIVEARFIAEIIKSSPKISSIEIKHINSTGIHSLLNNEGADQNRIDLLKAKADRLKQSDQLTIILNHKSANYGNPFGQCTAGGFSENGYLGQHDLIIQSLKKSPNLKNLSIKCGPSCQTCIPTAINRLIENIGENKTIEKLDTQLMYTTLQPLLAINPEANKISLPLIMLGNAIKKISSLEELKLSITPPPRTAEYTKLVNTESQNEGVDTRKIANKYNAQEYLHLLKSLPKALQDNPNIKTFYLDDLPNEYNSEAFKLFINDEEFSNLLKVIRQNQNLEQLIFPLLSIEYLRKDGDTKDFTITLYNPSIKEAIIMLQQNNIIKKLVLTNFQHIDDNKLVSLIFLMAIVDFGRTLTT